MGKKRAKPGRSRPARKPNRPEPVPTRPTVWRAVFVALCAAGLLFGADLMWLHVRVHTDPAFSPSCALSEEFNCESVAASTYSVVLGLPVALWGIVAYLVLGLLAICGVRHRRNDKTFPFGLLFWCSAGAALAGMVLFAVSHWVVGSICLLCGATYLVNFGLVLVAWLELRRAGAGPVEAALREVGFVRAHPRPIVLFATAVVAGLLVLFATIPPYWSFQVSTGPGGLAVGVTGDGHPWIGASSPRVTVEEYSDYQCPHCQRGHEELRRAIEAHPDALRLVHRHFPLDQQCNEAVTRPFHPYACDYAVLAVCADDQGKFWEANDFLFANGRRREPVSAGELAGAIGVDHSALSACFDGQSAERAVARDLEAGAARQVRGTPTFFVDGERHDGRLTADVLAKKLRIDATEASVED